MDAVKFVFLAWRAYWRARETGRVTYSAVTWRGVPKCCIFVAVGRDAWRVSQRAIKEFECDTPYQAEAKKS
jgi:hypothetical protein